MTPTLSRLMAAGLPGAALRIGNDSAPICAESLAEAGTSWFRTGGAPTAAAILENDADSVALVLGAVCSGARLVSLPVPGRAAGIEEYANHLRRLTAGARADDSEIIATGPTAALLRSIGLSARTHESLGGVPAAAPNPGGFELVQCTSGTTAAPKAIALSDSDLGINVAAILSALAVRPGDGSVSWLPLSHDMGLVGMLFTAIAGMGPSWAGGGQVTLLRPLDVLRRPSLWLQAIHEFGATITAAPDFGYRLATRTASEVDLSRLRVAIVGSEAVRYSTLDSFAAAHRPASFDERAFCPAYGLAEVGVAVTMTPTDVLWRDLVERADDFDLVSSGVPLEGYSVRCTGTPGDLQPIAVLAPSTGRNALSGESLDTGGALNPGDVGFLHEANLFVCGRDDDYIVAHGRNLHAPTIEAAVSEVEGVRPGRTAALVTPDGQLWIAVEPRTRSLDPTSAIARAVIACCGVAPDRVSVLGRGALPYTSSGKLRRRSLLQALQDDG